MHFALVLLGFVVTHYLHAKANEVSAEVTAWTDSCKIALYAMSSITEVLVNSTPLSEI